MKQNIIVPNNGGIIEMSSGVGLPTILFVVFLVLKLTKVIAWSWWWVFSPLLISWGIAIVIILIILMFGVFKD